jgi:glycine dehydrogenase subunit 2
MKAIDQEAKENPDRLHEAPKIAKVRRLDEVTAARKPCLRD